MRMEQKGGYELRRTGSEEESVSPVFHNHIMLSLQEANVGQLFSFACSPEAAECGRCQRQRQCRRQKNCPSGLPQSSGLQCLLPFSAAALRVGTSWNSASWRRLLKRRPSPQYVHLGDVHSESLPSNGRRGSDTVRKYAQIAICICCPFNNLLAQAVHGKNKDGFWISAREYTHSTWLAMGNRTCPVSLLVSTGRYMTPSGRLSVGYHACSS